MDSKRGSSYAIGITGEKATMTRDALAKAVYHAIFSWLASCMTRHLNATADGTPSQALDDESTRWIGLLDAFGFELLHRNSFEQLLINATNEYLQQFFLKSVMNAEQALYEGEGIAWQPITYRDNAPTIALLHAKPHGVMPVLDEETRMPKGQDGRFANRVKERLQQAGHEQSHVPPRKGKGNRGERARLAIKTLFSSGADHFTINHFAGEVCYEVSGWIEKNADILYEDLKTLMIGSDNALLAHLFSSDAPHVLEAAEELKRQAHEELARSAAREAAMAAGGGVAAPPTLKNASSSAGRADKSSNVSAPTICTRFARELESLMRQLQLSTVHFVRCLKPNETLQPHAPDAPMLLDQLLFSGMLEAVQLMRAMFPGRIPFIELHRRFQGKLPMSVMRLSPGDFVRAVVGAINIPVSDYEIGTSRLFFRTGGGAFLQELQHADPDELVLLLKDKILNFWALNSMLPAAVLGIRGRAEAARRRAAVALIHRWAPAWLGKIHYRRVRWVLIRMQSRRRVVNWARQEPHMWYISYLVKPEPPSYRGRLALCRLDGLANARIYLEQAIAQSQLETDLDALAETIRLARDNHAGDDLIRKAEARHAEVLGVRKDAMKGVFDMVACERRMLDLEALAKAVEEAQAVGVTERQLAAANETARTTANAREETARRLAALREVAAASLDLSELKAAIDEAKEAGADAGAVAKGEEQHAVVLELRDKAREQLEQASSPPAASLDADALEAALAIAGEAGVEGVALVAAQAKLDYVLERREEALQALMLGIAVPHAEASVEGLRGLVDAAIETGVERSKVEEGEEALSALIGRREKAAATLAEMHAATGYILRELEAAIAEARSAGLEPPPIASAEELYGVHREAVAAKAVVAQQYARRYVSSELRARMMRSLLLLQCHYRRYRVMVITNEVLMAHRMLRAGNVFIKFSKAGPPHDRSVWLSEPAVAGSSDGRVAVPAPQKLQWCHPEKRRKGQLKGSEAMLFLSDVTAISEGLKSELLKAQSSSSLFGSKTRKFRGSTSGITKLDQEHCLTVLTQRRSLDMQAPNRMIRRDWLMSLRLLLTLRNTQAGLSRLDDRNLIRAFLMPKDGPPKKRLSRAGSAGGFLNSFSPFFSPRMSSAAPPRTAGSSGSMVGFGGGGGGGGVGSGSGKRTSGVLSEAEAAKSLNARLSVMAEEHGDDGEEPFELPMTDEDEDEEEEEEAYGGAAAAAGGSGEGAGAAGGAAEGGEGAAGGYRAAAGNEGEGGDEGGEGASVRGSSVRKSAARAVSISDPAAEGEGDASAPPPAHAAKLSKASKGGSSSRLFGSGMDLLKRKVSGYI